MNYNNLNKLIYLKFETIRVSPFYIFIIKSKKNKKVNILNKECNK